MLRLELKSAVVAAVVAAGALLQGTPALAVLGACGNRHLPEDKIRKLDHSSIRLTCAAGTDQFARGPQTWDYARWEDAEYAAQYNEDPETKLQFRKEMQRIAQESSPAIRWSGSIPYATIESWDWVDWVYGPDEAACGSWIEEKEHCTTTPASESCSGGGCSTDSEGNQDCTPRVCTTTPASTSCWTERIKHIKSCWHDEPRHEERHCSTEVVKFDAEYVRPNPSEWGPGTNPDYLDILPNKYDLMPGETETVQIASNNGQTTQLSPSVTFGDAWNDYGVSAVYTTGGACRAGVTHNLQVKIYTNKRLTKKSPNAFRVPKEGDTLEWVRDAHERGKPRLLNLEDTSSQLISAMARQTRNFESEIINAKAEAGEFAGVNPGEVAANNNKMKSANRFKGFWRDTKVRVRLLEVRPGIYRDNKATERIIVSGTDVEIDGAHYRVPLAGSADSDNLYRSRGPWPLTRLWNMFTYELRPSTSYRVMVSMYQSGVPFYTKACGEGGSASMDCRFRGENAFFSNELPVEFETDANNDIRGFWQTLSDFQGTPWWAKPAEAWRILRKVTK